MRVVRKRVDRLTTDERKELLKLCYKGGQMSYRLGRNCGQAFRLLEDGRTLAWALLYGERDTDGRYTPALHVYVPPKYRRRGYGTRLFAAAKRHARRRIRVFPWNRTSEAFYDTTPGVVKVR